jgi:LPS-assembly lipoprotein
MWSSDRRAALRVALALPAVAAFSACGFQMRQPARLGFASIALTGFAPRSAMADALRRELARQVRVVDAPEKADVVLRALEDLRERSVAATTAAAQVRELQLRLRLRFSAQTPAGRELIPPVELMLARDLSYSETAALAKEQEEAELFRAMQSDIVEQVLRRLAAVRV